jgi:hypothetical protein
MLGVWSRPLLRFPEVDCLVVAVSASCGEPKIVMSACIVPTLSHVKASPLAKKGKQLASATAARITETRPLFLAISN